MTFLAYCLLGVIAACLVAIVALARELRVQLHRNDAIQRRLGQ